MRGWCAARCSRCASASTCRRPNTLGAPPSRILMRHVLPGIAGPLAVQATFGIGGIIVAEASLSFLGLGAMPPTPSWGNMLDAGRAFLLVAPHLTTAPGIAIGLVGARDSICSAMVSRKLAGRRS